MKQFEGLSEERAAITAALYTIARQWPASTAQHIAGLLLAGKDWPSEYSPNGQFKIANPPVAYQVPGATAYSDRTEYVEKEGKPDTNANWAWGDSGLVILPDGSVVAYTCGGHWARYTLKGIIDADPHFDDPDCRFWAQVEA